MTVEERKEVQPGSSLEQAIKDPALVELSSEYAELALDSVLDDGAAKDLPIVGTLVKLVSFGNSINKRIFKKKIYKFLFQLKSTSSSQRSALIRKINDSGKFQSSVGENLFEILEKIESDGKPEIVGKVFAALVEDKIHYMDFLKACLLYTSDAADE